MELKQLEFFISVAELGNMTKAAQQHYVSQPNITVAIKKLEDELGVELFKREYKKMTLTEKGTNFILRLNTYWRSWKTQWPK